MKSLLQLLLILQILLVGAAAAPKREENVFLFENRKLSVAVPDGFSYGQGKDDLGLINLQLAAPKDRLTLHLVFLPDPDGQFANARTRKEKMVELFQEYVDSSVEKGMQFEELEPRAGVGTYCAFTDASLVGKAKLAPGEFLHVTTGVKAWPGVLAIFRLFSQDIQSADYLAAMKMLRESVQERAVPLK